MSHPWLAQDNTPHRREPFRVNVRWGHLDRMPKCKHGRVICSECGL